MSVEVITDWGVRLAGRLYQQHKGLPVFEAVAAMLGVQSQALEDAYQQLLTISDIDASEGIQLDVIGRVVGQLRLGASDALYRTYLRARIRVTRSRGTHADLYAVFFAMLGADAVMRIEDGFPAGLTLYIDSPAMTEATARDAAIVFLRQARAAPVYAVLVYQTDVDAEMFTIEPHAAYLDGPASATDVSITVDATAGFPLSGSLTIDEGTADEEVVTYTVSSATAFAVSALANAHVDRAVVALVGSTGKGFDEDTAPGGGGKLAGDFAT